MHARGAGEQDDFIFGGEAEFSTKRITRVGSRIEIVFVADMRQDHAAEFLPQFFIGDCDQFEHRNKRLAVTGPGFVVWTSEIQSTAFGFHLTKCQWSAVLEKAWFVVIHIQNNRSVPVQLGENRQLQAGQSRFGYINDIALNLFGNIFHVLEVLRKVAAGETFYGNPAGVA